MSVANGVLLNPYHQSSAILINTKEADLLGQPHHQKESVLQILRSHLREEEHILDGRGIGHEHGQTVDSHTES